MSWIAGIKLLLSIKKMKDRHVSPVSVIASCIAAPVLVVCVLFSPGSSEYRDAYESAYNALGCADEDIYLLEDIRVFESYADGNTYENMSTSEAKARLSDIYLSIRNGKDGKKCYLRSDDQIVDSLIKKYGLNDKNVDEMMMNVNSIRNGRFNLHQPLEPMDMVTEFAQTGSYMILSSDEGAEVRSIGDGIVKDIHTDASFISVDGERKQKGLSVTIEYDIQKGLKEAEYVMDKLTVRYAFLSSIALNAGDSVSSGQPISKLSSSMLYMEFLDKNNDPTDPENYLYLAGIMKTGKFIPPLRQVTVISEVGKRALDDFHFGMDISDAASADVLAFTDGTIVRTGTNCAPFGGYIGNKCPTDDLYVRGAGNFVILSFQVDGKEYYGLLCHLEKVNVHTGDKVVAGDVIGTQGSSGNSSGTHLHVEIHEGTFRTSFIGTKAKLIDPRKFIDFKDGITAQEEFK